MIKNLSFSIMAFLSLGSLTEINAQCAPVDSFNESFEALFCCDMGVVPPCWGSLRTPNGNQIISNTSPATGLRNVYQFGYGNGVISVVVMPPLTNINAGTHHFKFKARVNSNPGFLEFGYVTDPGDFNSFVVLEPITITNSSYNGSAERIFNVPSTVPANAQLAIRNPGTTFGQHFWDDAVWEPKSNLSVKDVKLKKVKVYPNPATDFIQISEIEEVKEITISDASGRVVKSVSKPQSMISIADFAVGTYFVKIDFKDRSQSITEKIIKK